MITQEDRKSKLNESQIKLMCEYIGCYFTHDDFKREKFCNDILKCYGYKLCECQDRICKYSDDDENKISREQIALLSAYVAFVFTNNHFEVEMFCKSVLKSYDNFVNSYCKIESKEKSEKQKNNISNNDNNSNCCIFEKEISKAIKAMPLKPIGDLHSVPHYRCPNCDGAVKLFCDSPIQSHCKYCEQTLDWSRDE